MVLLSSFVLPSENKDRKNSAISKIFDDYCEEWAQFVLLNRDRSHTHPAHTYDIVIGPIADDGVTYQLRRYSMGDISMSRSEVFII